MLSPLFPDLFPEFPDQLLFKRLDDFVFRFLISLFFFSVFFSLSVILY